MATDSPDNPGAAGPAFAVRRRVVVTGMGIAGPLGVGLETFWSRLIAGDSGIGRITSFDASDLPAQVAGEVPGGTKETGGLTLDEWVPHKDQKKMDRFIHLGLVAAAEAVADSGWVPETELDRENTGVMIGSGIGGLQSIYEASLQVAAGKAKREQSSRQALFEQAEAYWNSPAGIAEAAHIQAFCEEWERQGRPAVERMCDLCSA